MGETGEVGIGAGSRVHLSSRGSGDAEEGACRGTHSGPAAHRNTDVSRRTQLLKEETSRDSFSKKLKRTRERQQQREDDEEEVEEEEEEEEEDGDEEEKEEKEASAYSSPEF